MDPITNADNTNVTPPSDGAVNDAGAAAMPPADAVAPAPITTPEPNMSSIPTEATDVVMPAVDAPTEPINGMSAPISDEPVAVDVPIDLPAVSNAPTPDATASPENIPVEPAPIDAPTEASAPDANLQNGAF